MSTGEKVIISQDTNYLLKRAVAEIIIEEELIELLRSGKKLRLKEGFDPSFPDIHLGHMVTLRKLRQFQELGHQIVLIVADWTAQIGDPSGVSVTRPMLSREQVLANAQTYMDQFFKVLDKEKTEVRWQSEWFGKFTLADVIQLTSKFTIAQLMAREDFSNRYSAGRPIAMTELLYPLLQAYDSVAIQADVEFGGTDQKFNLLVGRELQSMVGQRPQQCFMVPLLSGTDGSQKMSKSLGNYIGVAESPNEIYGKVMSIPDSLILQYFELVTDVPDQEVEEFRQGLKDETINPMMLKKRLARELVTQLHSEQAASEAEEHFVKVFQRRGVPEEIQEFKVSFRSLMDNLRHSRKVLETATRIALQMGLSREKIKNLQIAASLHDIGMIDTPDHIMFKKTALTLSEYAEVKLQLSRSVELLCSIALGDEMVSSIEAHHERYDGGGYPKGLRGKQIPLGARIIAVADAYDALTTERPYRRALTNNEAIKTLNEESGTIFDPTVVEALTKSLAIQAPVEDLTGDWMQNTNFVDLFHVLVATKLTKSRSEARRLLNQNAIEIDGKKVSSNIIPIKSGSIIKVGKRRFAKVINTDSIK